MNRARPSRAAKPPRRAPRCFSMPSEEPYSRPRLTHYGGIVLRTGADTDRATGGKREAAAERRPIDRKYFPGAIFSKRNNKLTRGKRFSGANEIAAPRQPGDVSSAHQTPIGSNQLGFRVPIGYYIAGVYYRVAQPHWIWTDPVVPDPIRFGPTPVSNIGYYIIGRPYRITNPHRI